MTLQELNNEIEANILIREIEIDEEYITHVSSLTFESNYIQIYYDYGIEVLLLILQIIERHELYEQCAVIKQTIDRINKLEKLKLPTTL